MLNLAKISWFKGNCFGKKLKIAKDSHILHQRNPMEHHQTKITKKVCVMEYQDVLFTLFLNYKTISNQLIKNISNPGLFS